MKSRNWILSAVVAMVLGAGCSADKSDAPPIASSPSSPASSVEAASNEAGGADFCSLYAARVSQGLVDMRAAVTASVPQQEDIATSLAAQAPVSQAELQAVAPPEPLGILQSLETANAAGAAGNFSAFDDVETDLVALNDWALANCGDDYAPVFEEYRGVIG